MKKCVFVFFVLFLTGCSHGLIGILPEIGNVDDTAEMIIIRNKNVMGAALSYKITLNMQDIVGIRVGEYCKFSVPAGQHTLGLKCFGGWSPTTKEMSIDVLCKPNTKYYFLLSPSSICAEIEPINEEEGLKRISKSEYLDIVK